MYWNLLQTTVEPISQTDVFTAVKCPRAAQTMDGDGLMDGRPDEEDHWMDGPQKQIIQDLTKGLRHQSLAAPLRVRLH